MKSQPRERLKYAIEAQSVLERMEEMYYRSGSVVVRPTTLDYNNVITALSKCGASGAAQRAERLLAKMESKYHDGDVLLMPNSESYIKTMLAFKNSRNVEEHVDGCRAIFERMVAQYQNGNHACKPTVESYNTLIMLCGSYNFVDAKEEDKRKALECVVDTVNKMRASDEVELNAMTHHMLLCSFGNLLPRASREQAKAVESIFMKCRADGFVDNRVLKTFHRVAPYDVFRRCAVHYAKQENSSDSTKGLYLPLDWSRNITGKRPIIPMSGDGNFAGARQSILNERKMRRLRTRKNQRLLQGGRTI